MCHSFRDALRTFVPTAAVPIALGAYDPQPH
jgi:hypothetical protein